MLQIRILRPARYSGAADFDCLGTLSSLKVAQEQTAIGGKAFRSNLTSLLEACHSLGEAAGIQGGLALLNEPLHLRRALGDCDNRSQNKS